jgi:DNA-binding beta-propeller fold protein YncE
VSFRPYFLKLAKEALLCKHIFFSTILLRFYVIILISICGIGINASSIGQAIIQKEKTPGIRAQNKSELSAPKGEPFNMPTDVAVSAEGDVYVLDGVNNRIAVYDAEGRFRFQFGSSGSELGQLSFPLGIATAQDGNIYVADSGNHRFQVFEPNGTPLETVDLPVEQTNVPTDPTDIAIDSVRHRLYVVDNDNHHILVYNLKDHRFESVWGSPGLDELQFRFPFLMEISDQGYLFVVEPINTRVQVLNPNGKFVNFIGAWGVKAGQLFRPKGVAIYNNKVFVSDSYLGRIEVFNVQGNFISVLADADGMPIKFITPTGVTIDAKNKCLYVVELKANRVCRLDLE